MARHPVAVIPVHNEAATIAAMVSGTRRYLPVIVVDDASNDASGILAARAGATVLTLPRHLGKGNALTYGFAEALRRGADAVLTLDGDGQHDPQDIPQLLAASTLWPASLIIGTRRFQSAPIPSYRFHAIQLASFWISWLAACDLQDSQSGLRLYPASLLRALPLEQGGFLLESEVLVKAGQAGCVFREVSVQALYAHDQRSQYRPWRDGLSALAYLFYRGIRRWPSQLHWLLPQWRKGLTPGEQQARQRTRKAVLATGRLPWCLLHIGLRLLQCSWKRLHGTFLWHAAPRPQETPAGMPQPELPSLSREMKVGWP